MSPTERRLLRFCELVNERQALKRAQTTFHESFSRHWIRLCTSNLLQVVGAEHVTSFRPPTGVMICSNHRSFFDMYVIGAVLRNLRTPWFRDVIFPVRSPFFYDSWAGLALNMVMGGGAMYPPIFRGAERSELNKVSVDRIVRFAQQPGAVVGMHPEGTRGKGPDPYELLKAQPGAGQIALQTGVPVLPIWIRGLSNDLPRQLLANFRPSDGGDHGIHVHLGPPVDLDDLRTQKPRATIYKRAADRILDAIRELGAQERAMSAAELARE